MDEARVSFFDTSSRLIGWCSGSGETRPDAGAWPFPYVGEDYGQLGGLFWKHLERHFETYRPTLVGFETPLMVPHDTLDKVRKLYGVIFLLETFCDQRDVPMFERGNADLKRELTGNPKADKDAMIEAATLCGIRLPDTKSEGRGDAADAFAGWLIGIREERPDLSRRWDRVVFSRGRGGLL